MREHWFWCGLTLVAMVWYSTITVYVAVRGSMDIKGMLARLKEGAGSGDETRPDKAR